MRRPCDAGGERRRLGRSDSGDSRPGSRRGPKITSRICAALEHRVDAHREFSARIHRRHGCGQCRLGLREQNNLGSLLELHTAASEFSQRPKPIARAQASNLLHQILLSLSAGRHGQAAAGAISRVSDRALFLIGHDTNIASVAGLLDLDWIADGRQDDTPPGGALVFELWQLAAGSEDFVRVYYTTQTLEQMRSSTVLTRQNPPVRVPVFVPACSRADFSCSLPDFERALRTSTVKNNP